MNCPSVQVSVRSGPASVTLMAWRPPMVVDAGAVATTPGWLDRAAMIASVVVGTGLIVPRSHLHGSLNGCGDSSNPSGEAASCGLSKTAYGPPMLPVQPAGATNDMRIGNGSVVMYRAPDTSGEPSVDDPVGIGIGVGVGLATTVAVGPAGLPTPVLDGPKLSQANATATTAAVATATRAMFCIGTGLHGTGSGRS